MGIETNYCQVHTTLLADDPLIVAEDKEDTSSWYKIVEEYKKWELRIKYGKDKGYVNSWYAKKFTYNNMVIIWHNPTCYTKM